MPDLFVTKGIQPQASRFTKAQVRSGAVHSRRSLVLGVGQQGGILCWVVSAGRVVSIVEAASTPWRAAAGLLAFFCDEGVANPWHGADVTSLDAEELASRIEVAFRAQGSEGPTFDRAVVVDVVGRGSKGLSPGEVAYATAWGLDRVFSSTFTQSWLADKPQVFVLGPGELFPISDMGLMGTSGYSTRPDRPRPTRWGTATRPQA